MFLYSLKENMCFASLVKCCKVPMKSTKTFRKKAVMTPNKKVVMIVVNDKNETQQFKVKYLRKEMKVSLKAGAVSTVVL